MLFDALLSDVRIPRFVRVRYAMDRERIEDIAGAVNGALDSCALRSRIQRGDRVCIAVGSRDIANYAAITRCVVEYVKRLDAEPFIIPAMGSHGGSMAEGQREILAGFGITEAEMGAPIVASMETVEIGRTERGFAVHLDRAANEADFIIPIGRIKPHTSFRGKVESGLCKMLVIGLGKQHGAYLCHELGFPNMGQNVWDFSKLIVAKKPNLVAVGTIENAYHDTWKIVAIPADQIHLREPLLLEEALAKIGKLPFAEADVLVLDEVGKDVSGTGMDTNVTGRPTFFPRSAPFFKSIMARSLTERTHGNFSGLGNADVIPKRMFDSMSFEATYPNAITAADARGTKIPIVMPNDRLALKFAIRTAVPRNEEDGLRIVWLRNTLCLSEFVISEDLVESARSIPGMEILDEESWQLCFDAEGELPRYILDGRVGDSLPKNP